MRTRRGSARREVGVVRDDDQGHPGSRLSSTSSACISSPVAGSRLPVGSSARRTRGLDHGARASATRCCSPPESSPGLWVKRCAEADALEQRARPRLRLGSCGGPAMSAGIAHILERGELGQQVVELEDEADGAVAESAMRAPAQA